MLPPNASRTLLHALGASVALGVGAFLVSRRAATAVPPEALDAIRAGHARAAEGDARGASSAYAHGEAVLRACDASPYHLVDALLWRGDAEASAARPASAAASFLRAATLCAALEAREPARVALRGIRRKHAVALGRLAALELERRTPPDAASALVHVRSALLALRQEARDLEARAASVLSEALGASVLSSAEKLGAADIQTLTEVAGLLLLAADAIDACAPAVADVCGDATLPPGDNTPLSPLVLRCEALSVLASCRASLLTSADALVHSRLHGPQPSAASPPAVRTRVSRWQPHRGSLPFAVPLEDVAGVAADLIAWRTERRPTAPTAQQLLALVNSAEGSARAEELLSALASCEVLTVEAEAALRGVPGAPRTTLELRAERAHNS